jgi:hypothetical protein
MKLVKVVFVTAICSMQLYAHSSNWSFSAAYGTVIPRFADSTTWAVKNSTSDIPMGTTSLNNANFIDFSISNKKSYLGLMYSSTTKNTNFITSIQNPTNGEDKFFWKYSGIYLTYNYPLESFLSLKLALGSANQKFGNDLFKGKYSNKRDLSARVGLGITQKLSKDSLVNLDVNYQYFQKFSTTFLSGANSPILQAKPKFDASGIALNIAYSYLI